MIHSQKDRLARTRRTAAVFGLLAALLLPTWSPAAEVYGTVELVEGSVQIVDPQGGRRTPRVADTVSEGDLVITGRDGELHLRTDDHGFMALRGGTRFRIDAYSAHGDATDKTVVTLLEGALRSITGWIGKVNPRAYSVRTASATIGIRGTDHETTVILPPEVGQTAAAAPGTYDKVNRGSTVLNSDRGSVVLEPNQAAFAEHEGRTAPRKLDAIPAIYKPTPHEGRIDERRETLAREMTAHRTERQKEVEEKQRSRPTPPPRRRVAK